ncbi:MAG: Na+-transporting NADH:ubiquinone oxidoreductase subunit F [Desulfobacteraceae bacterium Eth-SRB2]|nr:MAG: Na+-transporting NADH:ubiquinone oxidoreductase subunit F [Desulfobacteraceae bacterium Eth-SRB2]
MLNAIFISVGFLAACGGFLAAVLVVAEKKILNYGPCNLDINAGEKELAVDGGSPLLSALAENSIFIPSACGGRGSCAYCKLKVLEGAGFVGPVEEHHLTPEELETGVRLSCQVKIRNDLKIEIPKELFAVKHFRAKLIEKEMLTYDIAGLRIELIEPQTIDFVAGQYIQLESEEYKGREAVMRAYSISSVPSDNRHIELMIRKVPEGICTTWVFDYLQEGKELYFSGPYGEFQLSETDAPIIFIAGGSGMAPIWSIIQRMVEKGIHRNAVYFFGALSQKDLFYADELNNIADSSEWFKFVPALSQEPEDSNWQGERGLITDVVKRYFPDTSAHEAYLCGSPGMINACISVLTEGGLPEEKIYFDKFA